MDKMEEYREKLQAQLKEWKAKLDMLEEKASRSTGETKEEMMSSIKDLREKKELVKEKYKVLQIEGGVALDKMKEGVDVAASELKSALDKVISRFK